MRRKASLPLLQQQQRQQQQVHTGELQQVAAAPTADLQQARPGQLTRTATGELRQATQRGQQQAAAAAAQQTVQQPTLSEMLRTGPAVVVVDEVHVVKTESVSTNAVGWRC